MLDASAEAQSALPSDASTPSLELSSRKYLFGDWGGERSALEEKGVKFDFFYITDMQANPSGGIQQTYAGWERIRGTIDINFDKMIQWQGTWFYSTSLLQSRGHFPAKSAAMAANRNPSQKNPPGTNSEMRNCASFWSKAGFFPGKSYPGDDRWGGLSNGGKFPTPAGIESSGNYLIYGMASQP